MNYELQQELKDAGFGLLKMPVTSTGKPEILYYTPTLSELIEACGDVFYSLEQKPVAAGWSASAFISYEKHTEARGSTPEEAVARLYLALHA